MKVFVALACLIAVANAIPALLSTGTSTSSRTQDAAGNYAFAYNEQHATGGSSRKEAGSPLGASGSYTLNVADGRQRVVKYVADGLGFRAAIATNEPGTAAAAPAATSISSPYAPPQAPEPLPAPVLAAPALIAPAPAKFALAAPAPLAYGPAPIYAEPLAVKAYAPVAVAPAVSTYSTAINHAAPAKAIAFAAPALAIPAAPALALKGYDYAPYAQAKLY